MNLTEGQRIAHITSHTHFRWIVGIFIFILLSHPHHDYWNTCKIGPQISEMLTSQLKCAWLVGILEFILLSHLHHFEGKLVELNQYLDKMNTTTKFIWIHQLQGNAFTSENTEYVHVLGYFRVTFGFYIAFRTAHV